MKIQQWLFKILRKQNVTDGQTDAHTDGQRENNIPTTNKVCGGYNYFMINLQKSMGPGLDHTRGPWVCSQTRCQMRYGALGLMYKIKFIHLKSVYRQTILCIGLVRSLSITYECGTRLGFHILDSLTPTSLVAKAQSFGINLSWNNTTTCTSMCKFIYSGKGVGWGMYLYKIDFHFLYVHWKKSWLLAHFFQ